MSRIAHCTACRMLEQGVKFRIAPKHTCGKNPKEIPFKKSIKIPRVDPDKVYDLKIQRTGIVERPKALMIRCVKQEIEGVTIPRGYEVWLPNEGINSVLKGFSSEPIVHVWGWKLNEILRTLYMEGLRNA